MILASQSPRRQQLLREAGFELTIHPANIDEKSLEGETPTALVKRLARTKAQAVTQELGPAEPDEVLIAADTIVWQDNTILGKPCDAQDAKRMLHQLSGTKHHVSTGVCLLYAPKSLGAARWQSPELITRCFVESAEVSFYPLTDQQIAAYVESGEPADKAGAYGIQGKGRLLVQEIRGDYFTIVGLPVARVVRELQDMLPTTSQLLEQALR